MQRINVNGIVLEYEAVGAGEPLLLISPVFADGFAPLSRERALADRHRLIRYHRRGFGGSTHLPGAVSVADHAADAAALLQELGIARAHVAGHSAGAPVALQLALDRPALVHTVADSAFIVSPGLFQRYAQEHPQIAQVAKQDEISEWRWAQKRFEALKLHRKQRNGFNIWTCEVSGPRKSRRLHGYLLGEPRRIFDEVPPNNPYLRLIEAEPA